MTFRYRIHGLAVASDLPLPDARADDGGPVDVRIVAGPCDTIPAPRDVSLRGDARRAVLTLPDSATFVLEDGARMTVLPHSDDAELVRTFVLGSAWAVLLHQRNVLPLHGCALEWRGQAYLFVGEQGAGKSTLAAALLRAGARLVSDDVTAIDDADGGAGVPAGLRSMKLALPDPSLGVVLGPTADARKLRIVPYDLAEASRYPLAAIVELARSADGDHRIERIRGAAACGIAIRHTFRGLATARIGESARHLAACAALTGAVPVHRLERPWDLSAIAATADWLLAGGLAEGAVAA